MGREKSAIIGTVGVPANYGGFETIVDQLAHLYEGENEIYVYCSKSNYQDRSAVYQNFKLIYLPMKANGLSSIFYDIISIIHAIFILKVSRILILGVSGCFILPVVKLIKPSILITTNIDGLEWRRDKWNKIAKIYLKFNEKIACKYSDYIISDNEHITKHITKEYNKKSTLLSCGGEHAVKGNVLKELDLPERYYLKICRIEPENNIEMVLSAFSKSADANLVLVGNWNHSRYAMSLKEKYSVYSNIQLIGPTYNKDEIYTLRYKCFAYVHGHSAGGTNPSLVEILHFKKIPICFDCEYNRASTFNTSLYFSDENDLLQILEDEENIACVDSDHLYRQSLAEYNWKKISDGYFNFI